MEHETLSDMYKENWALVQCLSISLSFKFPVVFLNKEYQLSFSYHSSMLCCLRELLEIVIVHCETMYKYISSAFEMQSNLRIWTCHFMDMSL